MSSYEPLRGKGFNGIPYPCNLGKPSSAFYFEEVKSAVDGLIKYHEDRIVGIIEEYNKPDGYKDFEYSLPEFAQVDEVFIRMLELEYEHIQEIEHWLVVSTK